jgi:hypothetical protein
MVGGTALEVAMIKLSCPSNIAVTGVLLEAKLVQSGIDVWDME